MSRTVRWQVLLIAVGMALVGTLLTYLALTYVTEEVPTIGGTYVEGMVGTPLAINPLLAAYNETDNDLCALIFGGLTRFNGHGEVEPNLAQNWDISPDGLSYVFHLRPGVRWHDGAPFTAADVLFTVGLLQDPDYPGPPDVGRLWRTVRVTQEDNLTIRFTLVLSEPYAPFLDYTTIGILPAHLLQGVRASDLSTLDFNYSPVGTGPFQVEEIEVSEGTVSSLLLRRNPIYYREGPMLENIRVRFYPTAQSAFHAYQLGDVGGVSQITLEALADAEAETAEGLRLYSAQTARYALILMNLARDTELPFFQEAGVRQAMLYGLDRQRLIENILHGQAIVAHSPIVAGTWAYDEGVRTYSYDPQRAGALLEQAGWRLVGGSQVRSKNGQLLAFDLLASTDPIQAALAEEIARQWRELGMQVNVVTVSPLDVHTALDQRNYEAALVELAIPGDPDPYPLWHQTQITTGQNYAGLDHRRISEVIEMARINVDRTQRLALYREFQDLFTNEVPAILLYHPIYTYGVNDKVYNVQIGPLMSPADRFQTVTQWYIARRRVIISQAEANLP